MSTDVIVALVAAVASVAGVIIASVATARKSNQDILSQLDKSQALMNQRIDELTREVRTHNNFAEKIPAQEERIKALERDVKEIKQTRKGSD